ncbi:hypothetical protein PTH_0297 [Pelotomaculum thermopropionicum SI]|uniref:Uncharacterized protein n=1 Tax=Pelotomaculum thermopropionicum (strain DSM 13744 / JCM 10971 / SI) TaxID=370438 RepID=A5D5M1_PELTS|nr:hypothetical protein PTH_0297 [Pelotomaculum thermopropionicum SI]
MAAILSLLLPADSLGGVFQQYAQFLQPVPDPVGGAPVLPLAGFLAHFQDQVDQPFHQPGVIPRGAVNEKPAAGPVHLKNAQHFIEFVKQIQGVLQDLPVLPGHRRSRPLDGRICLPGQVENGANGQGGVEVVVHGGFKRGPDLVKGVPAAHRLHALRHGPFQRLVEKPQAGFDPFQAPSCSGHFFAVKVQRAAVVGGKQKKAHQFRRELRQYVAHQEEVAERLGHLLFVYGNKAVVHPVTHERLTGSRLALGNFVFVVGENKVVPPAVDVKVGSQVFQRHCRTFDVPARPAGPPGAVPAGLTRLCRLPEGKVQGVALARIHLDPGPGLHVFQGAAGKLAVPGKLAHLEVNVAVHHIGRALFHQFIHHFNDVGDVLRHQWVPVRPAHVQGVRIFKIFADVPAGKRKGVIPLLLRPVDDLVVHVGKVLDEQDLIALMDQVAPHGVKKHQGAGVAQVDVIIRCGAADVHADPARFARLEVLFAPG